jgi:hypothetical protein
MVCVYSTQIQSAVEIGINIFNYVKVEANHISNERLNSTQVLLV